MTTTQELLNRAIALCRQGQRVPLGELGAAQSIGRRYQAARSRYAQSAGMSEHDADFIIRKLAAKQEG